MTHGPAARLVPPGAGRAYLAGSRSDPFGLLVAEHALLRQQFARALRAAGADGSAARAVLAGLSEALMIHQRREDHVLYPVCERLFGGKEGAAWVLRGEHVAIAEQLATVVRESGTTGRVSLVRLERLGREVDDHFAKEERVLFPLTAALLSGTETGDLARRLRAVHPA